MTAYRSRSDGRYPVTVAEIRAASGALFADEPPPAMLNSLGLDPVQAVEAPAYDPAKQILAEGPPERTGGVWHQTWTVTARPADPAAGFIPPPLFRQRAEAMGIWADVASYLAQNPAQMLKVLTLEAGIDPADAELNAGLDEMKIPKEVRDILLAPPGG